MQAPESTAQRRERLSLYLSSEEISRPLPERYRESSWSEVSDSLKDAILDAITEDKYPLVLFGDPGLGKSCAMAILYAKYKLSAKWYDCGELLRSVASCRMSKTGSILRTLPEGGSVVEYERTILDKLEAQELVCLDDVGVRTPSDSQRAIFENIMDRRKNRRTILTTNLEPSQIADVFDMRLVSRVYCGSPIKVTGQDRRILNGNRVRQA